MRRDLAGGAGRRRHPVRRSQRLQLRLLRLVQRPVLHGTRRRGRQGVPGPAAGGRRRRRLPPPHLAGRAVIRRVLAVLVVLAAALTALVLLRPEAPGSADPDRGCPTQFPHRMTGDLAGRLFSRAVAALVICSDPAGRTTMVANRTEAVWTLRAPTHVVVQRDPRNALNRSFLRIAATDVPALPPGSVVVVARPPSEAQVEIDPRLTLAKLVHDELAASLAAQNPLLLDATVEHALAGNRTALSRCLDDVVARIVDPGSLLISGNPVPGL